MRREPGCQWSVLIPVYLKGRRAPGRVLLKVLDAYKDVSSSGVEIVIVCDGEEPSAESIAKRSRCPFPMRVFHQEHRGQSVATNRAAREARGKRLLFSAQDVIPHPSLIEEHRRAHHKRSGAVVLGQLKYPAELEINSFMRFLVNGGPQFAYDRLRDGHSVPPYYLYAPNFSMSRADFQACGGFREDLPYGCQDTELGLRLALQRRKILYCAAAVGYHWHPQELADYASRQYRAGRSTVMLAELHPKHRSVEWLKEKVLEYYVGARRLISRYMKDVRRIESDRRSCWRVRVKTSPVGPYEQDALWFLYDRVTKYHFYRGVYDGLEMRRKGWLRESFAPWRLSQTEARPEYFRVSRPAKRS